jgi:hypothetical protein
MPQRTIVVVSQAPAAHPQQRALEEDLITGLMLEEGIDVNVVPHLEHLAPESTGRLCLEGIAGDWVLFSWLAPAAAWRALAARGVRGQLGGPAAVHDAEELPPDLGTESLRTIYCLDLHTSDSAARHLEIVRRLRDNARVRTFSLGLFPKVPAGPPAASAAAVDRSTSSAAPSPPASHPHEPAPVRTGDDLDQLLDQLDALDL